MAKTTTILKAGSLLQVDTGEYSDYSVMGFFVVLTGFDPLEKRDEWIAQLPSRKRDYSFRENAFLLWLVSQGLLLEIARATLHLSDCADRMTVFPFGVGDEACEWKDRNVP